MLSLCLYSWRWWGLESRVCRDRNMLFAEALVFPLLLAPPAHRLLWWQVVSLRGRQAGYCVRAVTVLVLSFPAAGILVM